jgi:hypothetical protein
MKVKLTAILTATIMLAANAVAGQYRSEVIQGSGGTLTVNFTLNVPAGRAVSIINFIDTSGAQDAAQLFVQKGSFNANVLIAKSIAEGEEIRKDVIIAGPAVLTVKSIDGHKVFLSYQNFAN